MSTAAESSKLRPTIQNTYSTIPWFISQDGDDYTDFKKYDFAVVIGRFQPFHDGHMQLVKAARQRAKAVIIILGSASQSRDIRNPWTEEERSYIIAQSIIYDRNNEDAVKLIASEGGLSCNYKSTAARLGYIITSVSDSPYNEQAWIKKVQTAVDMAIRNSPNTVKNPRVCLFGQAKDHTSYYLKMFPRWSFESTPIICDGNQKSIDATKVREEFFECIVTDKRMSELALITPAPVATFLSEFATTPECQRLVEEYKYIKEYKKKWASSPFPPMFVTTDAVVVQAGHIIMVTRGGQPGNGLLALPGGFLNQNESIVDCMLRELKEETRLKVHKSIIKGSIKRSRVYDYPTRSQRGRVISHAYLIELEGKNEDRGALPKVRGSDDAAYADWYPLASLQCNQVFEDHYHIIMDMLGMNE